MLSGGAGLMKRVIRKTRNGSNYTIDFDETVSYIMN